MNDSVRVCRWCTPCCDRCEERKKKKRIPNRKKSGTESLLWNFKPNESAVSLSMTDVISNGIEGDGRYCLNFKLCIQNIYGMIDVVCSLWNYESNRDGHGSIYTSDDTSLSNQRVNGDPNNFTIEICCRCKCQVGSI